MEKRGSPPCSKRQHCFSAKEEILERTEKRAKLQVEYMPSTQAHIEIKRDTYMKVTICFVMPYNI